ncbi:MAG: ATP-binding protein [Clostridium sp.]
MTTADRDWSSSKSVIALRCLIRADFRIEIDAAKSGGVSDPRNGTMLKMFNLIDIGERAGSGIPNIFRVWREQGWKEPVIAELSEPDRIILSLSLLKRK